MRHARTLQPAVLTRRPRVSVVIPLYNYARFLPECLDSVLCQDGVVVDVLIIDDASTDDSLAVARRLAAGDPRVTVRASEQNRGMIPTINDGLWAIDGEYAVKMDADDILTPGSLARATALLDADESVGFVYGFPVAFSESPPQPPRTRVRSWTVWPGEEWLKIRCRKGRNCIMQPEVVMRTAVLHRAGPYKPEFPHGSDFEMWLRMAALANVGRVNGPDQGYYRIHPQSMQRQMENLQLRDLEVTSEVFASAFADPRVPGGTALNRIAQRAVARNALWYAGRARDEDDGRHVEDYLALAASLSPELSSRWRARERRSTPRTTRALAARAARNGVRWAEARLRWRRWRWSGV